MAIRQSWKQEPAVGEYRRTPIPSGTWWPRRPNSNRRLTVSQQPLAMAAARRSGLRRRSDACSPTPRSGCRPGQLELVEHVDDLVLDHLERGDGPVELHPVLGVLDGHLQRRSHAPTLSAQQRDADVVDDAPRAALAGRPRGPTRRPASPSRSRRATLRVTSMRERARRRAPRRERPRPSPSRATTIAQSAVWPSSTSGLCPSSTHASPAAPGAWPRSPSSGSPCPPSSSATVARTAPVGQVGEHVGVAEASRRRASPPPPTTATGREAAARPSPRHDARRRAARDRRRRAPRGRAARPAEVDDPAQSSSVKPRSSSIIARTYVGPTSRGEEGAGRGAQGLLLRAEREVHGREPSVTSTVSFARRGLRLHGRGRGVPRRAAGVARREPPRLPRAGRDRRRARSTRPAARWRGARRGSGG